MCLHTEHFTKSIIWSGSSSLVRKRIIIVKLMNLYREAVLLTIPSYTKKKLQIVKVRHLCWEAELLTIVAMESWGALRDERNQMFTRSARLDLLDGSLGSIHWNIVEVQPAAMQ